MSLVVPFGRWAEPGMLASIISVKTPCPSFLLKGLRGPGPQDLEHKRKLGSKLLGSASGRRFRTKPGRGAALTVPPAHVPPSSALLGTTSDLSHGVQLSPTPYLCSEGFFFNVLKLKFYFILECSWFAMLYYLQVYSKVIQLFIYPLPFRLFYL